MSKFIGVIPSRYASSRFPGKPLVMIGGKTMIQRVYEQVSQALDEVVVATDDTRIKDTVKSFGGNVIMTDSTLPNGTARCFQAVDRLQTNADIIINIQGDEPFINPKQIETIKQIFENSEVSISTLIKKITAEKDLTNPNIPKVIINKKGEAIYFSRSTIPFLRNVPKSDWLNHYTFYKHIGLYAYRKEVLEQLVNLSPTANEKAESLEQLRWIDHGYKIQTGITEFETIGIDTPEDIDSIPKSWL